MSRAYRIQVNESLHRLLRAGDHVSTTLEILEILPAEEMAALLEVELSGKGFQRTAGGLVRENNGVVVSIDPKTGKVTARIEADQELILEREDEATVYDDQDESDSAAVRASKREQLRHEMELEAKTKEQQLQTEVTDRLEAELIDLRSELDQAVNRVTAEALKQKAARLGQIKEMTEDPETGSLTIVLEV